LPSPRSSAFVTVTLAALSAFGCGGSAAAPPGNDGAAGAAPAPSGCGSTPPPSDKSTAWTKHDIDLPAGSVDPAFIAAHPPNAGSQYDWTHRNYFVKLPDGYDSTTPYPVTIAGGPCAGNETSGANGEFVVPNKQGAGMGAIKIAESYVVSDAVSSCNGFADGFTTSPEPAYLHAVIAEVKARYCVDGSKVFINGFDSGAFQAITAGCTSSTELRAYGVQIGGGLRLHHPPCADHPIAAMFVVATQDTADPIGPLATPLNDSLGSAPARDDLLARNGCAGDATAPWNPTYPKCVTYTGCPPAYPVVWCPLDVDHGGGSDPTQVALYRYQGLWDFYTSLPGLVRASP